jgi:3-hydroxyacyl-[acyl-carrier-protein] dehydratase
MSDPQEAAPAPKQTMDIGQIMALLPHRFPFLLIDRVLEIERKQRIIAIKNVTVNEPFFQGHFPDFPIMPGVLIIEAIAQAGGCLLLTEFPDRAERLMLFTGIESARFRRPVVPGDQLRFEVSVVQWRSRAVKMLGIATVDGKVACEATIMCQLVPRPAKPVIKEAPVDTPAEAPSAVPAGAPDA